MELLNKAGKNFESAHSAVTVFSDFDLNLDHTGCTAIIGPNGCGKSTVASILLGMDSLSSGVSRTPCDADLGAAVLQGYRTQLAELFSSEVNILLPYGGTNEPQVSEGEAIQYVSAILKDIGFNLDLKKPVEALSGGEQQALVFSRSMLYEPELWVADEPASAIDYSRRINLLKIVRMRSRKIPTLMITHDLNDAILVADRLMIYDKGMVLKLDNLFPEMPEDSNIKERLSSDWANEIITKVNYITYS